jgi:hypothetical protein
MEPLSRLETSANKSLRCVTSQKSKDIIYAEAKAWKNEHLLTWEESVVPHFNPLKTKRRLLYLKPQFVPRSKHFSSRL